MPSPRCVKSVQTFFGNVQEKSMRANLSIQDVPHNDEGLRRLSAEANWSDVLLLAEELIAQVDADSIQGLSRKLRYVLVQVTAYFHMQRYAAAKKIVDALGDLNSDGFIDVEKKESIVPFSLRFISALLPSYCGARMETQRRLYFLLDECQQQQGMTTSTVWVARLKRVQRALIVSHYQAEQYAEGLRLFEMMITAERYDDKGVDHKVLQQMLHLQQFATLCLHCGNIFLAEDVFYAIEGMDTADESIDVQQFHRLLVMINRALSLTFNDKVAEAAHIFREVAQSAGEFCRGSTTSVSPPPSTSSLVPTVSSQQRTVSTTHTTGARIQSALCQMAFRQLWVSAATSHVTCMPYEGGHRRNPAAVMTSIIDTMEAYLRQNPVDLLHCNAFLGNCARLYTLEGNTRQKKLETLTDMLEAFRCERECTPALDRMI